MTVVLGGAMKNHAALCAVAFSLMTGAASAQDCTSLLDTTITPVSFAEASRSLHAAPLIKDEFETTTAFEARVAAARQNLPSTLAISVELDKDDVTYNADAGEFIVKSSAFGSAYGIDWFSAFYNAPTKPVGYTLSSEVIGLAVSSKETPTGTYMGQNAYGASWEIVKIDRNVDAIFDGVAPRFDQKLFGTGYLDDFSWKIAVPAANARQFKESLRAALIVVPQAPFYIENRQPLGARITMQNPRDVTQIAHVIVADVKCAVLTNANNYVLMAITTN